MTPRVGLLVPSSNVTMEIELPALLGHTEGWFPSFHSARMRMTAVTPAALAAMDGQAERCAAELADAEVDVLAYACLVAVMVQGPGAHRATERRLSEAAGGTPVVSSAGALIDAIHDLDVERVAMITPYPPALAATVVRYLAAEGIEVVDAVSLGLTDNAAVARLDPQRLVDLVGALDLSRAQAVVASACVQMPSLGAIDRLRHRTGLPTLSAATATAGSLRAELGFDRAPESAGRLRVASR
jgi:maleate isomerase